MGVGGTGGTLGKKLLLTFKKHPPMFSGKKGEKLDPHISGRKGRG